MLISNIERLLVCLKCSTFIPIEPHTNFTLIETLFRNAHKGHLICIMNESEFFAFVERQAFLREKR